MKARVLGMAILATLFPAFRVGGAESAPKLGPGSTFAIEFPDMPPTFADLLDHNGVKPVMTVFLPTKCRRIEGG